MKNSAEESSTDSGVLSAPLSFLRSSRFGWDGAGLSRRGSDGYYWDLRSDNTSYSNYLRINHTLLAPQRGADRGDGFAVCVARANPSPISLIVAIL